MIGWKRQQKNFILFHKKAKTTKMEFKKQKEQIHFFG